MRERRQGGSRTQVTKGQKTRQGRRKVRAGAMRHAERRSEGTVQEECEGDARQEDGGRRSDARQGEGRLQGEEVIDASLVESFAASKTAPEGAVFLGVEKSVSYRTT